MKGSQSEKWWITLEIFREWEKRNADVWISVTGISDLWFWCVLYVRERLLACIRLPFFIYHLVVPFEKIFAEKRHISGLVLSCCSSQRSQSKSGPFRCEAVGIKFSHLWSGAVQRNWKRHNWNVGWRWEKQKSTEGKGQFRITVRFCIGLELGNFIDFQNRFVEVKRFMPSSLSSKSVM